MTAPRCRGEAGEDRQGQGRERGENANNRGLRKNKLATLGVPAPTTVVPWTVDIVSLPRFLNGRPAGAHRHIIQYVDDRVIQCKGVLLTT
jgi:hypothetical protein